MIPHVVLPLSVLRDTRACYLNRSIAAFAAAHGRQPGETDTLADWMATAPTLYDLLWVAAVALPRLHPDCADALRLVPVAVAARAARRVLPVFEAARPGDTRPRAALDLVDGVLRGAVADVAAIWDAADDARDAADDADDDDAAAAAAAANAAAGAAHSIAADADAAASADSAACAANAVWAATDTDAERAQPWADLWELLSAALEVTP